MFVVGAGASVDFGFPMGDQLKDRIAGKLNFRFGNSRQGDQSILETLMTLARRNGHSLDLYVNHAQAIASAMPQAISIDNFLHAHSDVPELVQVGKLAIAASILEAESVSPIRVQPGEETFSFSDTRAAWHNTFCKILTENVQRSSLESVFENVCFITFNYDRCIEHYIAHWLANYMRLSFEDACDLTRELTIFHPYGQVGKLPWQDSTQPGVSFGAQVHSSELIGVSEQIRTFTERVEDDGTLASMRSCISAADTIVYLGFSYGSMNLDLLQVEVDGPKKDVYGTAYKISERNVSAISGKLKGSLTTARPRNVADPSPVGWCELMDMTCDALLNDWWRVLAD
ncbi:MAG: hypothetical protein KK482_09990 [Sinorhizobium meliloti]|nr:hypothetical protein [Sinorhizobium meliloti]